MRSREARHCAIAENGGLFYDSQTLRSELLIDLDNIAGHRQNLAEIFRVLQSKLPQIQESEDNQRSADLCY